MLTIKLSRTGRKKQPYYRLVVLEKHKDPWGDNLEFLGNYNPRTKEVDLKTERIKYWLSVGAETSDTVHNLLIKQGIIEDKKTKSVKISLKRKKKIEAKNKEKEESKKTKEDVKVESKPSTPVQPAEETMDDKKANIIEVPIDNKPQEVKGELKEIKADAKTEEKLSLVEPNSAAEDKEVAKKNNENKA